ncbi:hypothetical protein PIB30_092197 [Stylosanthes scabra]|uniref:Uncharacterized protein n=1 Tax=Stylosanthes scabra TaxID=79078 RepID=A0ABU6SVN1_9FABA|nr:hypothetical protein [Stylosanthes scabra]
MISPPPWFVTLPSSFPPPSIEAAVARSGCCLLVRRGREICVVIGREGMDLNWGKRKLRLHAPVYSPVLIRKRVRAVRVFPLSLDSSESVSATISILGVTGDLLLLLPECCCLVLVAVIAGN